MKKKKDARLKSESFTPPAVVVAIETEQIVPSPFEPQVRRRAKFKTEDLESLGASIEKHTLLQAILVRPLPFGKYEIVFGERRHRASALKGLPTVNAIVRNLSDAEVLELQYEENHRRLDKDPLEDAFFFKFLIEKENYTSERIADRFGLDAPEVRKILKLNDLIRAAADELSAELLPLKHAIYLASFPEESQAEIVRRGLAYKYHDRTEKPTSFDDFKEQCETNIIRRLADAPFDTFDGSLHWSGLVCGDCPERTGFPGQLFPELAKNDSCLNKYCFDWKTNQHLKRRRERIARQMPNPEQKPIEEKVKEVPLVTTRQWTDEKIPFAEKVLTGQKLLAAPECEYSEISLIVEGERKGSDAFICREKTCAVHNPAAAREKPELQKKEDDFQRKVAILAREKVFQKAIEVFDDYTPLWMYADLVRKLICEMWVGTSVDVQKNILSIIRDWKNLPKAFYSRGDVEKFVDSLDRRQQSQLIFLLIFKTEGYFQNSGQDGVKLIAADYTKSDYRLFDAEARLELAPDEFRQQAADYLDAVRDGIPAEAPAFWWGFDDEAASATTVVVE